MKKINVSVILVFAVLLTLSGCKFILTEVDTPKNDSKVEITKASSSNLAEYKKSAENGKSNAVSEESKPAADEQASNPPSSKPQTGKAQAGEVQSSEVQSSTVQSPDSFVENTPQKVTGNPAPADANTPSVSGKYIANTNTKKFHRETCGSAKTISEKNILYSSNRDELMQEGYKPCARCNP